MPNFLLAFIVVIVLLAAMLLWGPLLQTVESLSRRYSPERYTEMPDLREEDTGPQYTGKVS
jgi:hypothetical protein